MERSLFPSYHMHLSTRDMARVGYLMLREGNWDGEQIIPAEWARTISSVVTPLEELNPDLGLTHSCLSVLRTFRSQRLHITFMASEPAPTTSFLGSASFD